MRRAGLGLALVAVAAVLLGVGLWRGVLGPRAAVEPGASPGTLAGADLALAADADALAEALERFKLGAMLRELVMMKEYDPRPDESFIAEQSAILVVSNGAERMSYDTLPRRAPRGFFAPEIARRMAREPFHDLLERFSGRARAYFDLAGVADERKLRVYRALVKLTPLDQLVMSQRDDPGPGYRALTDGAVARTYTLLKLDAPARPGAFWDGTQSWAYDERTQWESLFLWVSNSELHRSLDPRVVPDTVAEMRKVYSERRTRHVSVPPGPGQTLALDLLIGLMSPAYSFEVTLSAPGSESIPLAITQPGSREWLHAMDGHVSSSKAAWGRVRYAFPARWITAPEVDVTIAYTPLKGLRWREWSSVVRSAYTRQIELVRF